METRTLQLNFVPMDNDLLTFHMPGFFREMSLYGDYTSLPWVARSVLDLEAMYGPFIRVHGIGDSARMVADLVTSLRVGRESASGPSAFSEIILFDRAVDKVGLAPPPLYAPLPCEDCHLTPPHSLSCPRSLRSAASSFTAA